MTTTYKGMGYFECVVCNYAYEEVKMMDVDDDDESRGSLIFCTICQKWERWK